MTSSLGGRGRRTKGHCRGGLQRTTSPGGEESSKCPNHSPLCLPSAAVDRGGDRVRTSEKHRRPRSSGAGRRGRRDFTRVLTSLAR